MTAPRRLFPPGSSGSDGAHGALVEPVVPVEAQGDPGPRVAVVDAQDS